MEYNIHRLSKENLHWMNSVSLSSFGVEFPLDELHAQFDSDYTGVSYVGYFAVTEQNEIAAYYGVFPIKMEINGVSYLIAQSGNTMTHKDHQGRGLFIKLAKTTYDLCEELNVDFVFGFPNQQSFPGFQRKLNWKFQGDMHKFSKRIYTFPLIHLAWKYSFFKKILNSIIKSRLNNNTYFENSAIQNKGAGIARSVEYWKYKQFSKNFVIQINGVKIWLKITRVLQIGDIEFIENANYQQILKILKRKAFFWGCTKIVFQSSSRFWLNEEIIKSNFKQEISLPIGYYPITEKAKIMEDLNFVLGDFDTF